MVPCGVVAQAAQNAEKFTLIFAFKVRGIHLDLHDVSQGPHGDSGEGVWDQ